MRYYYDTEFKEDGKTIDLISIGIVAEDGREYYAVSSEFDTRRVAADNWLMANVMSSIDHKQFVVADYEGKPLVRDIYVDDDSVRSRNKIAQDILDFTAGTEVEWWNWYGAYDHVALCQLFGKMIDLPNGMPMYSNDIKQLHKLAGFCKMPQQPEGLHNALADAKFNVVRYDYLWSLLNK